MFQSFKSHQLHDPLEEPGTADLTADVDFANLKRIFEAEDRLITFGPIEQGTFLRNMQAEARLENLMEKCREEEKETLKLGFDMLVNPEKMGQRFKFLSFYPKVLKNHLIKYPVCGF